MFHPRISVAADAKLRVAIVGAGDIGRGWAALCVAAGWPVAIYDVDARATNDAPAEIARRANDLVALERAHPEAVRRGLEQFRVARSLLLACQDAQWVIEAGPEDLKTKQKMFEAIESVAGKVRAITSSSSSLATKDIAARCIRQERCMVTHPLNPPELIPLVEVVPGPSTDGALLEVVKGWLRALDRFPVVIKKQLPGNVASRIAAAVWREAIHLVLEGVITVDDLDRAVSLGPALGWAAAGPHLTYHLAAGEHGVTGFFQRLIHTFEELWTDLAAWTTLDNEQERKLIQAIEKTYAGNVDIIRRARDRRLGAILRALEQAKGDG